MQEEEGGGGWMEGERQEKGRKEGECNFKVYTSFMKWCEREKEFLSQNTENPKVAAMLCQSTFLLKRSNINFSVSCKSQQNYRDYLCACQQIIMSISEFPKIIQKNSNNVCVMSYKKTWGNSTYINLKDDTIFHQLAFALTF